MFLVGGIRDILRPGGPARHPGETKKAVDLSLCFQYTLSVYVEKGRELPPWLVGHTELLCELGASPWTFLGMQLTRDDIFCPTHQGLLRLELNFQSVGRALQLQHLSLASLQLLGAGHLLLVQLFGLKHSGIRVLRQSFLPEAGHSFPEARSSFPEARSSGEH